MNPFWITFYSYKGGVGRSLALANIAALLVQRGRRVALIDFDLEAPGLDSFHEFKPAAAQPGVVEYVTEFKRSNCAPEISKFVHSCELPGHLRGKLWIMPAGRKDEEYNLNRANLNWSELYESGVGEPFVENWKAAIARYCQPDYILVDSRTGLTDVGGICTLHLPDLVVMIFGLNDQNVKGVDAVAKTIRASEFTRIPQLHYVVSPVPNLPRDKRSPIAQRFAAAQTQLGVKLGSILRYHPAAALNEKLFVLADEFEDTPLVVDYNDLVDELIEYNRSGLDFLEVQVRDSISSVTTSRMQRLLSVLREEYPNRSDSLSYQSQLELALGHPELAQSLAEEALRLDPTFEEPFSWLLEQHQRNHKHIEAIELCNATLKLSAHLSPERIVRIHNERGASAMAAREYKSAQESFSVCLAYEEKHKAAASVRMSFTFNLAEASRKLKEISNQDIWREVISLFDESGETADAHLTYQANRWQAMHIAYAMTGDLSRAREALKKSRHAADLVGQAEDIFTVKTYTEVPRQEFLATNDEMLAALDRGQLWDGMPLPTSQTEQKAPTIT